MSTQHRNTEARSRSRVIPHAELEPLTYKIAAECLCLNLRKASRLITQYYDQILEPAGIRCTQLTILAAISRIGNRSLTDLAQSLAMDRTTLTRNLKPLEKHGWVIRVDSPNHRMRNYALSDSGEQVLKEAVPLWQEAQNSIVGMLGDSRRKRLFQHLLRVTAAGRRAIKKEEHDSELED
ncbi:MAG: MarR family transcriptional regulator [Spirochaetaceae bacterium]|mgnify:FL=1|nr:MarR family transcriptional regulator [Spirochaetaceae bacterium]|tara:strand:+ start:16851 stop:17390 length:540 start_codon:yes stop_codon:yes gene_type:complete